MRRGQLLLLQKVSLSEKCGIGQKIAIKPELSTRAFGLALLCL